MATQTSTVLPVLGCLAAIEDFIHATMSKAEPCNWISKTSPQIEFLREFREFISGTRNLDFLKSKADFKVAVVNQFLRENGFTIQLKSTDQPGSFAVACILDVLLKWRRAKEDVLNVVLFDEDGSDIDEESYPAIHIDGDDGASAASILGQEHPVVSIQTDSTDVVHMCIHDGNFGNRAGLLHQIGVIESKMAKAKPLAISGVTFPMVDLDRQEDISFLVGMETGNGYFIDEAIQQTKFRMNEKGARAQSAAAMHCFRCCVAEPKKEPVVIDEPFILWITRPGVKLPIFAGYFEEDVWKRPASLE